MPLAKLLFKLLKWPKSKLIFIRQYDIPINLSADIPINHQPVLFKDENFSSGVQFAIDAAQDAVDGLPECSGCQEVLFYNLCIN